MGFSGKQKRRINAVCSLLVFSLTRYVYPLCFYRRDESKLDVLANLSCQEARSSLNAEMDSNNLSY